MRPARGEDAHRSRRLRASAAGDASSRADRERSARPARCRISSRRDASDSSSRTLFPTAWWSVTSTTPIATARHLRPVPQGGRVPRRHRIAPAHHRADQFPFHPTARLGERKPRKDEQFLEARCRSRRSSRTRRPRRRRGQVPNKARFPDVRYLRRWRPRAERAGRPRHAWHGREGSGA